MEAAHWARLCFNVALLAKLWFTGVPWLAGRSLEISDVAAPPPRQVTGKDMV
jgi:hypothetical protein